MPVDVGSAQGYLDLDISGFMTGLATAQAQAASTMGNIQQTASQKLTTVGGALKSAGSTLTKSLTLPIVAVGGLSLKTAATFESSMSKVSALSGATGGDLEKLSTKAQQMGAKTKFSASEAADAMGYMALAGWDTNQMLEGIDGVLSLAAAGEMDLAAASDMVTDYLSAFGLEAKDASHMSDVLAKTSTTTNTSVTQLGDAFGNCATNAHASGVSLEQTSALLGVLANNGLKGSEAGTALSAVFRDMTDKMEDGKIRIGDTAVQVMDAAGNYRDFADIVEDVTKATDGMGDAEKAAAMSSTFTSRSLKGMRIICDAGADSVRGLTDSLVDSKDAASNVADELLNNLNGQLTIIKSSLEGVGIKIGQALMPYVKEFAKWLQTLLDKLNSMSDEQIQQAVKIAAVVAAIGPLLLLLGNTITKIVQMTKTIKELKAIMTGVKEGFSLARAGMTGFAAEASPLGAAIGGITLPIIAVIGVIVALVAAFVHLWKTNDKFRNKMIAIWEGMKEKVSDFVDGIKERFAALGISLEDIVNGLKAIWEGFCDIMAPIFEGAFEIISAVFGTVLDVITGILDVFIGLFTGNWEQLWTGVKEIFGGIWDGIVGIFSAVIDTIKGIADAICGWFGTTWDDTWNSIKQFFIDTWNGILDFFSNIGTSIKDAFVGFITGIITFFKELPKNIWDTLVGAVQKVIEWRQNMIDKAKDTGKNFIQNVINFLKDLPKNLGYILGLAIGTIVKWSVQLVTKAKEAGKTFVENVITFFKELPGKIWNWLVNTITKVIEWRNNMIEKAKELGKSFIENVITFFKELPGKVWNFYKGVITKTIEFISSMVSKAVELGSTFISNVISFFQQLPGKIWSWFTQTISKAAQFAKELPQKGLQAGKDLIDAVVTGVKELPAKMLEIGKNIVEGVWNGIVNAKDTFVNNVKDFFGGIVDGVKDALGIHSPSRVFRDEVGKNIALGVVEGILKENSKLGWATERMNDIVYNGAKEGLKKLQEQRKINEKQTIVYWDTMIKHTEKGTNANKLMIKEYNKAIKAYDQKLVQDTKDSLDKLAEIKDVSAKTEASYWKKVLKKLKKGTREYKVALKNYNDAVEKQNAEALKKYEDKLNDKKDLQDMNAKQEEDYWANVLKKLKKGTDAYNDAMHKYKVALKAKQDEIVKLKEEYKDKVVDIENELASNIKSVIENYNSQLDSVKSSLKSSLGLFDEFSSTTENTSTSLIDNLQSQVNALQEYRDILSALKNRKIIPTGMLTELEEMGIDSLADLKQINKMTDEELSKYISLWQQKENQITNGATQQLIDTGYYKECITEIQKYCQDAYGELNNLAGVYDSELLKLGETLGTSAVDIAKNMVDGLNNGITNNGTQFTSNVLGLFTGSLDDVKAKLGIHSPSTEYESIGENIILGAANGILNMKNKIAESMKTVIDSLKQLWIDFGDWIEKSGILSSLDKLTLAIEDMSQATKSLGISMGGDYDFNPNKPNNPKPNNPTNDGGSNVQNTYNFYSEAKLSEVECRHEMIQAQKEMALDF